MKFLILFISILIPNVVFAQEPIIIKGPAGDCIAENQNDGQMCYSTEQGYQILYGAPTIQDNGTTYPLDGENDSLMTCFTFLDGESVSTVTEIKPNQDILLSRNCNGKQIYAYCKNRIGDGEALCMDATFQEVLRIPGKPVLRKRTISPEIEN
jgi:hypothetical protein